MCYFFLSFFSTKICFPFFSPVRSVLITPPFPLFFLCFCAALIDGSGPGPEHGERHI